MNNHQNAHPTNESAAVVTLSDLSRVLTIDTIQLLEESGEAMKKQQANLARLQSLWERLDQLQTELERLKREAEET
jgi:TolA-binding protein